jgi:transposase-like protein
MQKLSKYRKISNDVKFYALCKYRNGCSVSSIVKELNVTRSSVYRWIKTMELPVDAKAEDYSSSIGVVSNNNSSVKAFNSVVATAGMNELETSEYCHNNSIEPDELATWRNNCMNANDPGKELDVKELLKIIDEKNALLKEKDELINKQNQELAKQTKEIQELEHTTAALAGLAICAKKAEAFFSKKQPDMEDIIKLKNA